MSKVLYYNRPLYINHASHGGGPEEEPIRTITLRPRRPDEEQDSLTLIAECARAFHDADGNPPSVEELAQYALADSIRENVRPYFEKMF